MKKLKNIFNVFKNVKNNHKSNMKNTLNAIKIWFQKKKIFLLGILISLLVVMVDQITKHDVLNLIENIIMKTNGVHTHIRKTSFFNLVLVWNRGISFGVFNGSSSFINTLILVIITMVICYILYVLWKNQNRIQIFCFSLVLGGAVGNVIDRFIYGAVIDFIDIHVGKLHWPAFNVADACICVGVFVYLLDEFLNGRKDGDKQKKNQEKN